MKSENSYTLQSESGLILSSFTNFILAYFRFCVRSQTFSFYIYFDLFLTLFGPFTVKEAKIKIFSVTLKVDESQKSQTPFFCVKTDSKIICAMHKFIS